MTLTDTMRKSPHHVGRKYLSLAPRTIKFQGQINGDPLTDDILHSVYQMNIDNLTGTYPNHFLFPTIDFGTVPGARDLGQARMRPTYSWSASKLFPSEFAPSEIPIQDNDYFSVIDEYLVWHRKPRIVPFASTNPFTDMFIEYHDYGIPYNGENSGDFRMPVKVNLTRGFGSYRVPKLAGWVDQGETYREITISAEKSELWGNTPLFYQWIVGDCTFVGGAPGPSDDTVTLQVPVGFRHIICEISMPGGTSTRWRVLPLWTHDEGYPPITEFKLGNREIDDGLSTDIDFFGDAKLTLDEFMGCERTICYWEEDVTFGADPAPAEYMDQALMWTHDKTARLKRWTGNLNVKASGVAGHADKIEGFPQTLTHVDTPANSWYRVHDFTVAKEIFYIADSYSTIMNLCNMFFEDMSDIPIPGDEISTGSVWGQLTDVAPMDGMKRLKSDSENTIFIKPNPSYLEQAERDTLEVVMTLTAADALDKDALEVSETGRHKKVGSVRVEGAGFDGTGTDVTDVIPLVAQAPGLTRNQSSGSSTMPYQRMSHIDTEQTICRLVAHGFEYENNPYGDITFKAKGNYHITEPAHGKIFNLTWQNESQSGLSFVNQPCQIESMSIDSNDQVTFKIRPMTIRKGLGDIVPPEDNPYTGIVKSPYPKWDFIRRSIGLKSGNEYIGFFSGTNLYRTSNFISGNPQPTWDIDDIATLVGEPPGTISARKFVQRAGSPTVDGMVLRVNGASFIQDLWGTPTLVNGYAFVHNGLVALHSNISDPNIFVAVEGEQSISDPSVSGMAHFIHIHWTDDSGNTWTSIPFDLRPVVNRDFSPVVYISATTRKAYTCFPKPGDGQAAPMQAYEASLDDLNTWTMTSDFTTRVINPPGTAQDQSYAEMLFHPLEDAADTTFFLGAESHLAGIAGYFTAYVNGVPTNITLSSAAPFSPVYTLQANQMDAFVYDKDIMVICAHTPSFGERSVFATKSGIAGPWNKVAGGSSSSKFRAVAISGDNPDFVYAWGTEGFLGYTSSFFQEFRIRTSGLSIFTEISSVFGGP